MQVTLEEEVVLLLDSVQAELRRQLDQRLRLIGLNATQYWVLRFLHEEPGRSNAELSRLASVKPQSMSHVVEQMERAGLLHRSKSHGQGRIIGHYPTERGKRAYVKAAEEARTILLSTARFLRHGQPGKLGLLLERVKRGLEPPHETDCEEEFLDV